MKILIVDDEPGNVALLANALKGNYEILTANNGYEAISVVREQRPDLVLLDVMMPEMDGFEVYRLMRSDASSADMPIIFVTAMDSREGEERGLELGAVDYITKPVNIKLAKLRIRNQLELKQHRNIIEAQNKLLKIQKEELEATLDRVKHLEGIITICSYCKKIRTQDMDWQQLERYISDHSDAMFTHGVCPTCFEEEMKAIKIDAQK